jgi:rhodanese-related sulfurtransferase
LLVASLFLMVFGVGTCASLDLTAEKAHKLTASKKDLVVVDVREPSEFCDQRGHIPGALNYPYTSGVFAARYEELPKDRPILVVCRSGRRSKLAAEFLQSHGFTKVYDMAGGMNAWQWETTPCAAAADSNAPTGR